MPPELEMKLTSKRFVVGVGIATAAWASSLAACTATPTGLAPVNVLGGPCQYPSWCEGDLVCNLFKKPPCDGSVEWKSYEHSGTCVLPGAKLGESCGCAVYCGLYLMCGPDSTCVAAPSPKPSPPSCLNGTVRCAAGSTCSCHNLEPCGSLECGCELDDRPFDASDTDAPNADAADAEVE